MDASPAITAALLSWYDRHRRDLPWRAKPDAIPDPYAVWLSEVMLQQTTVAAVKGFYARFLALWPDVRALAAAPREEVLKEWAGLGYYARARNLHDCAAAVVERHAGRFPDSEPELRALPGIGDYTAAALASIAFGRIATVVDGNVERVVARLYALETPLPAARPEIRRLASALVPEDRPGDFAQATMDFGATLCTPRSPACAICPVGSVCEARRTGTQVLYPRKAPRKATPQRFGAMAVVERPDGAVLVRTRPSKGLLGGMTEFFGSDWGPDAPDVRDLAKSCHATLLSRGQIDHVFTHFALRLDVYAGSAPDTAAPLGYRWVTPDQLGREPIPNAFAKVWAAARGTGSAVVALGADRLGLIGLEGPDEERGRQGENRQADAGEALGQRDDPAETENGRAHAEREQGKHPA